MQGRHLHIFSIKYVAPPPFIAEPCKDTSTFRIKRLKRFHLKQYTVITDICHLCEMKSVLIKSGLTEGSYRKRRIGRRAGKGMKRVA